jgi:hypothetical protein
MNQHLREYIDNLFAAAPQTVKTVEMKEEFLQNLTDKYNDLLAEGKTEEAAYNIAVASIGDVSGIVGELQGLPQQYVQISAENQQKKQRRAIITSIAIALYIICIIPLFIFQNETGLIIMFVIAAIATALLIYNGMTKSQDTMVPDTMVDEFQEWRGQNSRSHEVYKAISSAVWSLGLIAYFLISFGTGAWYITWVIFLLIGAINGIIKAIFDLSRKG